MFFDVLTQWKDQTLGRGSSATKNTTTTWIWKTLSSSNCVQGRLTSCFQTLQLQQKSCLLQ